MHLQPRITLLLSLLTTLLQVHANLDPLVAQLRVDPANVDRIAELKDDQFIFDFLHATTGVSTGSAGRTVGASASNFPAVIGNGIAMTIGFLDACGMNTPHTHPRATEINYVVNGTFRTGILAENGARFIFGDVPPGSASVFPKGAIHFEQNDGCEPAMFVAAFNHEDPGVNTIAQRYFGLPPDIVGATLGGLGVEEVAALEAKIPNNIALGTDDCLKRCGLTRPANPPTSQRQPRVKGNALPSGFSGPPPASAPAPAPPSSSPSSSSVSSSIPSTTPTIPPRLAARGEVLSNPKSNKKHVHPDPDPIQYQHQHEAQSEPLSEPTPMSTTRPLLMSLLILNVILSSVVIVGVVVVFRNRSASGKVKARLGSGSASGSRRKRDEDLHAEREGEREGRRRARLHST